MVSPECPGRATFLISKASGPIPFFLPGIQSCCLVMQQPSCNQELGAQARMMRSWVEAGAGSLGMWRLGTLLFELVFWVLQPQALLTTTGHQLLLPCGSGLETAGAGGGCAPDPDPLFPLCWGTGHRGTVLSQGRRTRGPGRLAGLPLGAGPPGPESKACSLCPWRGES